MGIGPKKKTNDANAVSPTASKQSVSSIDLGATAASAVVKADSAETDTLTITFPVSVGADGNTVSVLLTTNSSDALSVTEASEVITVALADTTATKNTAALIQVAMRALTATDAGVSLAGIVCAAGGDWDTAAIATGEAEAVEFAGGADSEETTLTAIEQLSSVIVITNASSVENIIMTLAPGKGLVIQNDTAYTMTIKVSGETGTEIETLQRKYVYCNTTDFDKLT